MLSILIETGSTDEAWHALVTAAENMDPDLAARINNAVRIEGTGMQIADALAAIGNSSSVYHTIPLAVFLCKRYPDPGELPSPTPRLLAGNTDTVTLLCGAFTGARYGLSALPHELISQLERRGEFELLAAKLMNPQKTQTRLSPEQSESSGEPESIYDSGWEPE